MECIAALALTNNASALWIMILAKQGRHLLHLPVIQLGKQGDAAQQVESGQVTFNFALQRELSLHQLVEVLATERKQFGGDNGPAGCSAWCVIEQRQLAESVTSSQVVDNLIEAGVITYADLNLTIFDDEEAISWFALANYDFACGNMF